MRPTPVGAMFRMGKRQAIGRPPWLKKLLHSGAGAARGGDSHVSQGAGRGDEAARLGRTRLVLIGGGETRAGDSPALRLESRNAIR